MHDFAAEPGWTAAPPTPDEGQRLNELYRLHILDTPPEERFDRLTRLVAEWLDVPICLISLVDERRQWFKSVVGLDVRETPRVYSICAYALHERELLLVEDTHAEPRFAANPLVRGEPHVRFYAGAVLRGANGLPVGTFCVIAHEPRQLTELQRSQLLTIARVTEALLVQQEQMQNLQRHVHHFAYADPVTGVANRRWFYKRAISVLGQPGAPPQLCVWLEVDRNEDLALGAGPRVASTLLRSIARRMQQAMPEGTLLARWELAEFALLVPLASATQIESVLDDLLRVFDAPFVVGEQRFQASARMGVSVFPLDEQVPDEVLRKAWETCRTITPADHARVRRYSPEVRARFTERFDLLQRLREDLAAGALQLAIQPKISLATGDVVGGEVLCRWHSQVLGPVSPGVFVPLAEEHGLIDQLGGFVLERTLRQLAEWQAEGLEPVRLAVNLSSHQLRDLALPRQVQRLLEEHGVDPRWLGLEVTESAFIEDPERATRVMQALRARQVELALDDFGTGYSSLSYLQQLPLDLLKLDASLVRRIAEQPRDAALVRNVITLAHDLGLSVVAEGVEEPAQRDVLCQLRCDQLQGFLFARPCPPAEFASRWLGRGESPAG